jgi:hypothetical protein
VTSPPATFNWNARSLADWNRALGSFSRQCSTISLSAGEALAGHASKSGSSCSVACWLSTAEPRSKSRTPVTIS